MKHFLGIDVGTTSVKAAVFDETGRRLALRSVDYVLDTDAATGFIEFDAERYATICRDVARELRDEVGGTDPAAELAGELKLGVCLDEVLQARADDDVVIDDRDADHAS